MIKITETVFTFSYIRFSLKLFYLSIKGTSNTLVNIKYITFVVGHREYNSIKIIIFLMNIRHSPSTVVFEPLKIVNMYQRHIILVQ